VSWLRKGKAEGPTEIEHLPVIYGNIHTYDMQRLKEGDKVHWVISITVDQGGVTKDYKFRFEVEVL
jgi:hypothetical protein